MITIAAIVFSVKLGATVMNNPPARSGALCGLDTTTVVFNGAPGTEFKFDGERYVVPAEGTIELVAGRTKTYEVEGRRLPVNASAADDFGRRTIQLPVPSIADASLESPLPAVRPRH